MTYRHGQPREVSIDEYSNHVPTFLDVGKEISELEKLAQAAGGVKFSEGRHDHYGKVNQAETERKAQLILASDPMSWPGMIHANLLWAEAADSREEQVTNLVTVMAMSALWIEWIQGQKVGATTKPPVAGPGSDTQL
jgi:hypothetical protein